MARVRAEVGREVIAASPEGSGPTSRLTCSLLKTNLEGGVGGGISFQLFPDDKSHKLTPKRDHLSLKCNTFL